MRDTKTKKRIVAGALSFTMMLSLASAGMRSTLAQDTTISYYSNAVIAAEPATKPYENVIFQGVNKDVEPIAGLYKYAEGLSELRNNGQSVRSAVRYENDFFAPSTNGDNNVYLQLTGADHEVTETLVCGGEQRNPAKNPVDAIAVQIDGKYVFLAGPYTSGGSTFYYADATYDNAAAAKQGATGDGRLQGPESGTVTDITVIYDAGKGTLTPTDSRLTPGEEPGGVIVGPVPDLDGDGEMDYLETTGTGNVYEVVDKDGKGKQPPKYTYDKNTDGDNNPKTKPGDLVSAEKIPDGYYVKDADVTTPSNEGVGHKVAPDGTVDRNTGVWVGPDGTLGTQDDRSAKHYDTDGDGVKDTWYADNGDNTFIPVKADGTGDEANIVGGGGDKNPSTLPVKPIYTDKSSGKHYVGPVKDIANRDVYYGDPVTGGNGSIDSTAAATAGDDLKYYMDADHNLLPEGPTVGPVPDRNGDGEMDYLRSTATPNVYEVVDENGVNVMPLQYVYDKNVDGDSNPQTKPSDLVAAVDIPGSGAVKGGYYAKDSDVSSPATDKLYHKVENNGTTGKDTAVWAGNDGKLGTGDDRNAKRYDTDGDGTKETWYADNGDNTFVPVKPDGTGDAANMAAGGGDKDPSTYPIKPIYTDPDTGKHYVGPVKDTDGTDVFYGDPATGGNGSIDSTATGTAGDDVKYFVDPNTGKPVVDPVTPVTGVTLNTASASLAPGKTLQLTATIQPAEAAEGKTITWASSNPAAATVSGSGLVTAVADGSATITATVDGKSAACAVTVASGSVVVGEHPVKIPDNVTLPARPTGDIPVSVWPLALTFEADGYAWRLTGMDKDGNFLVTTIDMPVGGELTMQRDEGGTPYRAEQAYYALSHYNSTTATYRDNSGKFGNTNLYGRGLPIYQAMLDIYENDLISMKASGVIQSARLEGITEADALTGYSSVVPSGDVHVFPLSYTEARYLMTVNGGQELDVTRCGTYKSTAYSSYPNIYLRSPYIPFNVEVHVIYGTDSKNLGKIHGSAAQAQLGYRPAMWVNFG